MRFIRVLLFLIAVPLFSWGQDGLIGDNPSLAYWKIGQKKQIVIVLHGGPAAQHEYLRPEFDAMSEVASVVYYDQRGCGKSQQATSYTWQDHVSDLERVIKAISPHEPVILAGSSWGSTLAMLYAYMHPQDLSGLILTGTYPWEGRDEIYTRHHTLGHYSSHKEKLREDQLIMRQTKNGLEQDTILVTKELELSSGSPSVETRLSCVSAPAADCLSQIRIPVLLFNGTKNQRWNWTDHYAKLFPNVKLHTLDAGHDPWINDPKQFFSVSNTFVNDCAPK